MLQAATIAQGGDLFLLDMGEPVRIKDLAEQMVRLSGLSLRDARNPDGDIEIICTGLRPERNVRGALIEAESEPTKHPLIYRARERALPPHELWPRINALEELIAAQDVNAALALLVELVPEWHWDAPKPEAESSTAPRASQETLLSSVRSPLNVIPDTYDLEL